MKLISLFGILCDFCLRFYTILCDIIFSGLVIVVWFSVEGLLNLVDMISPVKLYLMKSSFTNYGE